MVQVIEKLEIFGLSSGLPTIPKPLPTEESLVIGIIEAFYHSIPPVSPNGDKD
jgi:hypothetical protein